jgi:hypothetical protein
VLSIGANIADPGNPNLNHPARVIIVWLVVAGMIVPVVIMAMMMMASVMAVIMMVMTMVFVIF